MKRLPPTVERLAIGLVLCVAFLLMASVFVPDWTQAGQGDATITHDWPSTDPHEGLAGIGSIESSRYRVEIYAAPERPLYSVYDIESGAELGVLMTDEQVTERFPELPLPEMDYGTSAGPLLMLADPKLEDLASR